MLIRRRMQRGLSGFQVTCYTGDGGAVQMDQNKALQGGCKSCPDGRYYTLSASCPGVAPVSAPAPVTQVARTPAPVAQTITYNVTAGAGGKDRLQPIVAYKSSAPVQREPEVLVAEAAEDKKEFPWWMLAAGAALLLGN